MSIADSPGLDRRKILVRGATVAVASTFGVAAAMQRANGLPVPKGDFSLNFRAYWPKAAVTDGSWTPPAIRHTG